MITMTAMISVLLFELAFLERIFSSLP